ncbi:cupin domain-containing protein [Clostridium sp. P21]|uniref:Cupin domain-containing protein n=1 Tax=Clostridium muellerianum TaxID=2716538 RepID=A0A7Y0ELM4_9CLOT|nr:cupin domain-containing protein [Clostridium muellerianum]NMM65753.1 cupin domain-containing protein [Clostridium muellerianum]
MINDSIVKVFNGGKVIYQNKEINIEKLEWNKNPNKGVYLKHIVKGEDTAGKFSCHIVKIESGCEIGQHIHEGNWELHEVIDGEGKCFLEDKEIIYSIGTLSVIPQGIQHKVKAVNGDLYLFAKFIPALV